MAHPGEALVAAVRRSRHNQVLEVTSGELLPGAPIPLRKRRRDLSLSTAKVLAVCSLVAGHGR